jgi:MATE family multidrug resistance protein
MFFQSYKSFYKRNLIIAIPIVMSQLGQVLVHQVDNAMVGYVGTVELAAAAFAGNVFIVGMVFGMGFTFGLTPLAGAAFSNKNNSLLGELFKNSILTYLSVGLLSTLVLFGLSYFFGFMNQPPEVVELAVPYFRILVISYMPFLIFFAIKQFAEGLGNTIIAMVVTLISNLVNIILNYILIFGKFGAPELGLVGAGYATLVARVLMPLIFIIVFIYNKNLSIYIKYTLRSTINIATIKKLVKIGFPISIQMLLEVSAFALSAIMVGWIGTVDLASHQIAIGLAAMTFMLVSGISSATTIRVSHQFNEGKITETKKAVNASIHLTLFFMGFSAIIFFLFRNSLPRIYTNDIEVIVLTSQLLIVAAFFQLFDGLQVVILGALRGLEDVNHSMVYAFISYILINLPLGYLLGFTFNLGTLGIWLAFLIGLSIAALLFWARYKKIIKRFSLNKLA